jgi:hypothetical protein
VCEERAPFPVIESAPDPVVNVHREGELQTFRTDETTPTHGFGRLGGLVAVREPRKPLIRRLGAQRVFAPLLVADRGREFGEEIF